MKYLLLLSLLFTSFSNAAEMTEQRFNEIIDEVVELYKNEINATNLELHVHKHWDNQTVNAGVNHNGTIANFNIYGGYATHPAVTEDEFAMAICHEVGHLVGGAPRVKPTNKYSSEGQSDYFAASECFKRYLEGKDNKTFLKNNPPTLFMLEQCGVFSEESDNLKCLRAFVAIESFKNLMIDLARGPIELSIEDILLEEVEHTIFNDYPSEACRVETLKAGTLGKPRPTCWYKDPQTEIHENPYVSGYEYREAHFIGVAGKVTYTNYGCHVDISDIDFFGPSYLAPLEEDDLWNMGINIFGSCPYEDGSDISGTASEFKGKLYYNLNPVDKFLN